MKNLKVFGKNVCWSIFEDHTMASRGAKMAAIKFQELPKDVCVCVCVCACVCVCVCVFTRI